MQRLDLANSTDTAPAKPAEAVRDFLHRWLTGRRGLIVGGIAIVAAGLAAGWSWLTAIGAAPIILALAPCAAMCALGTCAMMKANSAGTPPSPPGQAQSGPTTPPNQSSRQEP